MTQARVFSMTLQEAQAVLVVIVGMFLVFGYLAHTLIDPDDTHSFISPSFIPYANVRPTWIMGSFAISLPTGM